MVPMAAASLGWLPATHPFYTFCSQQILPVCLTLLLIGTDLKGIYRLGPQATLLMLCGSLGTILGGIISFKLYAHWLPQGAWASVGALTASWIGGSANLVAVKEALAAPDSLIAPIILVDATVAYSWMALLLWASTQQGRWDQLISSKYREVTRGVWGDQALENPSGHGSRVRQELRRTRESEGSIVAQLRSLGGASGPEHPHPREVASRNPIPLGWPSIAYSTIGLALSVLISMAAQWAGGRLPAIGAVITPSTWTVLLVTTTALLLSLTPLRKLEQAGLSKIGTVLLYILLASIGARSNFQAIAAAPIFLALGATWILIHGLFLITTGYFLKSPLGMIAAASQANIGGTISAPIVGATYHPQLAGVGLLMAILGNILGTYLGLATAFILRS